MKTTTKFIAEKACGQCDAIYQPITERSRYCSTKCQQRAKYSNNPYNKETFGTGTTANRGRKQSIEHVKNRRVAVEATLAATRRPCVHCRSEFSPTRSGQKYCSGMCWNSVARTKKVRKQAIKVHPEHYGVLFEMQGGKCKICGASSGSNGRGDKLAVDHCHSSGHIRGLLCHKCNTALGLMQDSTANLLAAVAYLNEAATRN